MKRKTDYKTNIRDKPLAALQQIKVLAHYLTRSRYHYACIYESLEQILNIQKKDNGSIVMYKDTFQQNVEVLKTEHIFQLPYLIHLWNPLSLTRRTND